MKAAEKTRQRLSSTQTRTANAKNSKRWKINLTSIEEYLDYMEEENLRLIIE